MKLNTKRTILVGFAFLAICAFWELYDALVPLILKNTFKMDESISGYIMAADNVLAIFLLPLFGGFSDKCKSKLGRRRPFILAGTLLAVFLMMLLPLLDNMYFASHSTVAFVLFIVVLGMLLVAMGIYRSPAVALMPDVTPKPLRSKGNAVINLMGTVGGIIYLITAAVFFPKSKTEGLDHINYFIAFAVVGAVMLVSLLVLMLFVNEPKLVKEREELDEKLADKDGEIKKETTGEMTPEVKRSLIFLLVSVALWFIGYNAVKTWFSTYAEKMWDMPAGDSSKCLLIATVAAVISYIPVGIIASKIGRKVTILVGVALLSLSFGAAFVFTCFMDSFSPILFVIFALVGIAWASINVNSFPMVVEMCSGGDVGKFTGYYYTFSMFAQIITPILSGNLLTYVGYNTLFVYSCVFVALAFVTMSFVKHGDNKIEAKRGLEAFDIED
ncbi:MAG: MFS transporter [Acutalibacteraceae bacterium]|nr:MFS transporter [Acutalibacteraceae bacterium]